MSVNGETGGDTTTTRRLKAPFPWFGGKSKVAHLVWDAFGDPANYVEPFCGSMAVLLARPGVPRIETVNDLDCHLSNFWRSLQAEAETVAHWADWPVSEPDLHARHQWLVDCLPWHRERMRTDPFYYNPMLAGWWVWGICQWIGGGWCVDRDGARPTKQHPNVSGNSYGLGIHAIGIDRKRPICDRGGRGVHSKAMGGNKVPALAAGSGTGTGVHSGVVSKSRPRLGGHGGGQGVHSKMPLLGERGSGRGILKQQVPDLSGSRGASGRGIHASGQTRGPILAWMDDLAARLRRVRVCSGDWKRVLGPAVTTGVGITAVFLDAPYSKETGRNGHLYGCEDKSVAHDVRAWAIEHGEDPKLRIAMCGYEGEHEMPASWRKLAWSTSGGYGSRNKANKNRDLERIWFSSACLDARQGNLFTPARGRGTQDCNTDSGA